MEKFISFPEQGGDKLIPEGALSPGVLHTVAMGAGGHRGLYRLETQVTAGTDIPTVPGELFAKFQISFYADPVDAVFKALGVA